MFESKIVELLRSDAVWVQALLTEGLSRKILNSVARDWEPPLRSMNAPDAHWNWPQYWAAFRGARSRFLSLECESKAQGLMWLDQAGVPSRLAPGAAVVYVQRLSVAPWNRGPAGTRRFRPVGSILLREAVELSRELAWEGRIGLHALPSAVPWYKDVLRMTPFGPDFEHENLEYFEFSSVQARAFLANE